MLVPLCNVSEKLIRLFPCLTFMLTQKHNINAAAKTHYQFDGNENNFELNSNPLENLCVHYHLI